MKAEKPRFRLAVQWLDDVCTRRDGLGGQSTGGTPNL